MSDAEAVREIIKTRGYWEVDIRPREPSRDRFENLTEVRTKVEESVVSLRGWDYPHFGNNPPPYSMNRRIESYVNFGPYKDYWTMFINGHFYHIFACKEDWYSSFEEVFKTKSRDNIEPFTTLGFMNTLLQITEIFEYAKRLGYRNVFGEKVRILITLHNMKNRKLKSLDRRRHLWREYVCNEDTIPVEEVLSLDDLVAEGHNTAINFTIKIFEIFNWLDVNRALLSEAQTNFLQRKM